MTPAGIVVRAITGVLIFIIVLYIIRRVNIVNRVIDRYSS